MCDPMKRMFIYIIVCVSVVLAGCRGSEEVVTPAQPQGKPYGVLISHTDCKEQGALLGKVLDSDGMMNGSSNRPLSPASGEDCIEYRFSGDTLSLKHINAAFNCCPGEIEVETSVAGDTIIIAEKEKEALCDCLCLYDLKMAIYNVSASGYTIVVRELYLTEEDEPLIFTVDLAGQPEGKHCVKRNHYPW